MTGNVARGWTMVDSRANVRDSFIDHQLRI